MHKLFEFIESSGFISEVDLLKVDELSNEKLVALYEKIYEIVFSAQYPPDNADASDNTTPDPFSFMASSSIRADSGCFEFGCRTQKLDFLSRFTALYANSVTLPLALENPDKVHNIDKTREILFRTLTSLFVFRPLIEYGIVQPVVMRTLHCEHVAEYANEMQMFVHEIADWGAKQLSDSFEVTYQLPEKSPTGRSTAYIDGPEDFLEHGSLVMTFDEGPSWRPKSWKFDAEGKTILKGKRKLSFIEQIFNTIANDTTFYFAYGRQHSARFLTDKPGDAVLLDWLNQDQDLQASSRAMEFLGHSLPIIADIPLSTILTIRQQERDSFESYRQAITTLTADVLTEKKALTIEEAKDAFKAKLEPEIKRIEKEVKSERIRQAKRLAIGASSVGASVLFGLVAALPIVIKGALAGTAAAVGGKVLSKAAESKCEHGADIRQKNDLYFLLRLINE